MNSPDDPQKRRGKQLKHWIKLEPLCTLYIKLNEALFESVLPDIPCYLNTKLSRCLGRCLYYRDGSISVPYAIDFSPISFSEDFFDTFIHEMVHVWQGAVGRQPNHDAIFHICLKKKKALFEEKCKRGELSDQFVEMLTNSYPALPNTPKPKKRSTKAFPWTGWTVNDTYNSVFDAVNAADFAGLLPKIPIYENPRLKRSLCRFHMNHPGGVIQIVAGDVKPNSSPEQLTQSFRKLLHRCLNDMITHNKTIDPAFQPVIEHIQKTPSKKKR